MAATSGVKGDLRRITREETGQALPLALILVAAGCVLITPVLRSVSGTMLSSRKHETSIVERYAADASVGDAIWNVTYGDFDSTVLTAPGDTTSYSLDDPVNGVTPSVSVTRDRVTIASDGFESDNWSGGSSWVNDWYHEGDAGIITGASPYEGDYHLRLRGSTGYVKRAVDLSGQPSARLRFWVKVGSFAQGDQAECLVSSDGSRWTTVKTWVDGDDDDTYHYYDIDLSSYTLSSEFWIAFKANMTGTGILFIDYLAVERVLPGAVLGLPSDNFESGNFSGGSGWLYDWYKEGSASVTNDGAPHGGSYHVELIRANSYVKRAAELSGQSGLRLQVWAKVNSFEGGDYVECLVSPDDTNWTTVETWTSADSDNTYHFVDIDLSSYTMSSEFWIAFDSGMDNKEDYFYVDDLRIVGSIAYEIVVSAGDVTTRADVTVQDGDVAIVSWQRD